MLVGGQREMPQDHSHFVSVFGFQALHQRLISRALRTLQIAEKLDRYRRTFGAEHVGGKTSLIARRGERASGKRQGEKERDDSPNFHSSIYRDFRLAASR